MYSTTRNVMLIRSFNSWDMKTQNYDKDLFLQSIHPTVKQKVKMDVI